MAAQLGRKEAVPSRTEGIPSWAEGNPSQSEGNPNRAEGIPSRAEGNPNVCPSVKSRSFNGLRPTPAGGLVVTVEKSFRSPHLQFRQRRSVKYRGPCRFRWRGSSRSGALMKVIVADILIVRKRLLECAAIHASRLRIPKSGLCYSTCWLAETSPRRPCERDGQFARASSVAARACSSFSAMTEESLSLGNCHGRDLVGQAAIDLRRCVSQPPCPED